MRQYIAALLSLVFLSSCAGRPPGSFVPLPISQSAGAASASQSEAAGQPGIAILSDASVMFDRPGETYRLIADASNHAPISFSSRNPAVASVTQRGTVTAHSRGVTVIDLRAGGLATVATVIVAEQAPDAVIVRSEDVITADAQSAAIHATRYSTAIHPGQIVISGPRGHLFGRVTSMRKANGSLSLALSPVTLADAFPNIDMHISGATQVLTFKRKGDVVTVRYPDGSVRSTPNSKFECKGSAGAQGQNWSLKIGATPHLDFVTHVHVPSHFKIILEFKAVADGDEGVVTGGTGVFECSVSLGEYVGPPVPLGDVLFYFTATIEGKVEGSIVLGAKGAATTRPHAGDFTFAGPTFNTTYSGAQGVQYDDHDWSQINTGSPSGSIQMAKETTAPAQSFVFTTDASFEIEVSLAMGWIAVTIGKLSFFDLNLPELELQYSVSPPLDSTQPTYTGPTWNVDLSIALSWDLKIGGDLDKLAEHLGLPQFEWKLKKWQTNPVKLAGSPAITLSAKPVTNGGCTLLATIKDSHKIPINYTGDFVNFEIVTGPGAPSDLPAGGVSRVSSSQSKATTTLTPSSSGPLTLMALLPSAVLGSALPYASAPVVVQGSTCLGSTSKTFDYTGSEQDWDVPVGVTHLQIDAFGGLTDAGNYWFEENVMVPVKQQGETLAIFVGGEPQGQSGGYNGGGPGGSGGSGGSTSGGGGAGASDVREGGAGLANRIVVAAGHGGPGGSYCGYPGDAANGDDATLGSGGAGGAATTGGTNGVAGVELTGGSGGAGAVASASSVGGGGGGGGGGLFGGGGGGGAGSLGCGGDGGVGYSYAEPGASIVRRGPVRHLRHPKTPSDNNGQVIISW